MKLLSRPRARAAVAALVLLGLAFIAAARRDHDSGARREGRERKEEPERRERKPRTSAKNVAPDSPWASREACARALGSAKAPRPAGVVRVGAWNLHWFPDGKPGEAEPDRGTDLDWLACTIAWMQLDVLAVEEIKRPPRGPAGMSELEKKLDQLTGGSWQFKIDDCPRASPQHVGLVWNAKRATLRASALVPELNPHGEACAGQLRPGFAGYFAFPGGLDVSVVAAHLKSGGDERAFGERATSFGAVARAIAGQVQRTGDGDVLVLGDMNTMGCERCEPAVSSLAELTRVDAALAATSPRVARVPSATACSHRYGQHSTLLDWAMKSDLGELPSGREVTVSGVCGELGCDALGEHLPAQRRLSDHCPLWVDLDDADRD